MNFGFFPECCYVATMYVANVVGQEVSRTFVPETGATPVVALLVVAALALWGRPRRDVRAARSGFGRGVVVSGKHHRPTSSPGCLGHLHSSSAACDNGSR